MSRVCDLIFNSFSFRFTTFSNSPYCINSHRFMKDKKVRAAVVGLGGMGRRHLEAIKQESILLAAICDINSESIAACKEQISPTTQTFTDWHQLIREMSGNFDLLIVATNGPSHIEIVTAAAAEKTPYILCEKPMATSGCETRRMAEVCKENNCKLAINMSRRFMPRFIDLKRKIRDGLIGHISHINVVVGAGGLGCVGTHYFDFVSWIADSHPIWLIGSIDSIVAPNVRGKQFHDPGGKGFIQYVNGMSASFELSGTVPLGSVVQIIGTEGFLEIDSWRPKAPGKVEIYVRPESARDIPKSRFVQPEKCDFSSPDLDIVESIRCCLVDLLGEYVEDTVQGGIAAVDTVMGFHLSAQRNNQRVEMPLSGDDLQFRVPIT